MGDRFLAGAPHRSPRESSSHFRPAGSHRERRTVPHIPRDGLLTRPCALPARALLHSCHRIDLKSRPTCPWRPRPERNSASSNFSCRVNPASCSFSPVNSSSDISFLPSAATYNYRRLAPPPRSHWPNCIGEFLVAAGIRTRCLVSPARPKPHCLCQLWHRDSSRQKVLRSLASQFTAAPGRPWGR